MTRQGHDTSRRWPIGSAPMAYSSIGEYLIPRNGPGPFKLTVCNR
ncbi:hypothetical protein [Erwinia phage COW86c]